MVQKEKEGTVIYKEINKRLQEVVAIKQKIEYEIEQAKRSSKMAMSLKLTCKNTRRGRYQYYVNSKYISKIENLPRIKELAIAEYHKALLPLLEKHVRNLKLILKTEEQLEGVYTKMHEGKRILFEPEIVPISKLVEEFEMEAYEGLPFYENDHTEYFTNRGERVRSKSEKIIADELDRRQVPYKYEKPLVLLVEGRQREFYPDFTTLNITTGKIIYLEHLGMMDNSYYYDNTLSKLDVYEKNGLLIGRDVLLLHESARRPLNTRIISDYISEFLL